MEIQVDRDTVLTEITPAKFNTHHINLIKIIADSDRSNSKPTTFALQYMGDERTLMNNQGYSEEKSKRLVKAFHGLYKTYFAHLEDVADTAQAQGFVNVAYGLRIDTPALGSSIHGAQVTPTAVAAEKRSILNATSQSYGAINTIAATEFMERVWDSKWRNVIHMQALIHDAIYLFVPMDVECIEWVNNNLIDCMVSQMEPNIAGSHVHLESELDIHPYGWSTAFTLENNINQSAIKQAISDYLAKQ